MLNKLPFLTSEIHLRQQVPTLPGTQDIPQKKRRLPKHPHSFDLSPVAQERHSVPFCHRQTGDPGDPRDETQEAPAAPAAAALAACRLPQSSWSQLLSGGGRTGRVFFLFLTFILTSSAKETKQKTTKKNPTPNQTKKSSFKYQIQHSPFPQTNTSQPLGERKAAHKGATSCEGRPRGPARQGPHPAAPLAQGPGGAAVPGGPEALPRAAKPASPGGSGARRPRPPAPRPPRPQLCPAEPQAQRRYLCRPTAPSPLRPGPAASPAPRLPPPPPEATPGPASPPPPRRCPVPAGANRSNRAARRGYLRGLSAPGRAAAAPRPPPHGGAPGPALLTPPLASSHHSAGSGQPATALRHRRRLPSRPCAPRHAAGVSAFPE